MPESMPEPIIDLSELPPYALPQPEKEALLLAGLNALTERHRARCAPYARFVADAALPFARLEDAPYLPVTMFKAYDLRSVADEELARVVLSSATTSGVSSRIYVDKETADLLTNPEVIAIDQDALGRQARRVSQEGKLEVWARPLANGRVAAGLFNRGNERAKVTARWTDLGLKGKARVRDAWARKDLGSFADAFAAAKACTDGPAVIVANTVKGKGVSFMEGLCDWHGKAPNAEQCAQALEELEWIEEEG